MVPDRGERHEGGIWYYQRSLRVPIKPWPLALRVVCSVVTPKGALRYIRTLRKGITTTTRFRILPFRVPLELRFHNHTAPMLPGKFRGFDINDPTRLNDGTDDDVKPDLDSLNSNVAGPSQPRTGGDGRGMASPLPRRRHATPIRPRQHPYPRPKAVSDSDGLGSDLTSTGKSSVHPPSPRSHSHEESKLTLFRYLI